MFNKLKKNILALVIFETKDTNQNLYITYKYILC